MTSLTTARLLLRPFDRRDHGLKLEAAYRIDHIGNLMFKR